MTDAERLLATLQQTRNSPAEIANIVGEIHSQILLDSQYLDQPNFTCFHPADLKRLFELYDQRFFSGLCQKNVERTPLSFRISNRMTSAGGTTARFKNRLHPHDVRYEITISAPLLYQSFEDSDRPIVVTGLQCRDRLEAMQRIFEHELVHLIEHLIWNNSKCSASRFQKIAAQNFGHTDHRHRLVTSKETALKKHGIRNGSRVRFQFENQQYVGIVNRITKRATVLVENRRGVRYSDGKYYLKFYIPLEQLQPVS